MNRKPIFTVRCLSVLILLIVLCAPLWADETAETAQRMDARLVKHNGAMAISINGEFYPFTTFKITENWRDQKYEEAVTRIMPKLAERGIKVYFVPIFFDWSGPGMYDFSQTDWRINLVLKDCPDAWIVVRVQANPMAPMWWHDKHPEGRYTLGFSQDKPLEAARHQTSGFPSLGSDFWDEHGIPALRALVKHVRRQDYADRVIGYLPTAYNTNEWFFRSYNDLRVGDLSQAMQESFNEYMQDHYGEDREWSVPGRFERGRGDYGIFMNPDPLQSKAPVVEYYKYFNEKNAETILKITRTLREANEPDRMIIGTFYGYSMGLANFFWLPDSGHLAMQKLMAAEDGPDFTCSPLEYFSRNAFENPGGGFIWSQGTNVDSGLTWGRGYFGEDDFQPAYYARLTNWGSGTTGEALDVEALKRNFVFTLCKGQLIWWYDLVGKWFEGAQRLDFIEQAMPIAEHAVERDRSQVSRVAVVMDEQASFYVALNRPLQREMFWANFYHSFGQIGTPVDLLMPSDLKKADMSKYKAIFWPTCISLDNEQRGLIESLKSDGRTMVFYQATGLVNPDADEKISVDHISELAGIKIVPYYRLLQLRLTTGQDHPFVEGCENVTFGKHMEFYYEFMVEDDTATPFGYYYGRGPVGMAVKQMDGWKSVYCAVPAMPHRVVRNIVADAGVHIYSDAEDILYANKSYVGFFAKSPGKKTIRLPEPARVYEAFSKQTLAEKPVTEFTFQAEKFNTYLFELNR